MGQAQTGGHLKPLANSVLPWRVSMVKIFQQMVLFLPCKILTIFSKTHSLTCKQEMTYRTVHQASVWMVTCHVCQQVALKEVLSSKLKNHMQAHSRFRTTINSIWRWTTTTVKCRWIQKCGEIGLFLAQALNNLHILVIVNKKNDHNLLKEKLSQHYVQILTEEHSEAQLRCQRKQASFKVQTMVTIWAS